MQNFGMQNLSYAHIERVKQSKIKIGVLALQGAFLEHCIAIEKCGVQSLEVRTKDDLEKIDGLILPGGESTTMIKLIKELELLDPIKAFCQKKPILATCAGLILLAKEIQNHSNQASLGLMDIVVERNAYGRQKESFFTELELEIPTNQADNYQKIQFPTVFIRAPQIVKITSDEVKILAKQGDAIVAVKQKNMLACSFHPELSQDLRIHEWLISAST